MSRSISSLARKLLLVHVLVMTGCGGAAHSSGNAAACDIQTPNPSSTASDAVRAAAETQQWARLDRLFGRYLRGEVTTYVGTFSASDNQSVLGGAGNDGFNDATIPTGDAIASLVVDAEEAQLTVFSPSVTEYVMFQQSQAAPGVTTSSMILGFNVGGGPSATCSDCAPDFFAHPTTLDWESLTATFVDASLAAPLQVNSGLKSEVESPCSLSFDQFVLLDTLEMDNFGMGGLRGFVRVGNEMIEHVSGQVQTVPPTPRSCVGKNVAYTMDVFVNLSDLSQYGLRNYVLGAETDICTP